MVDAYVHVWMMRIEKLTEAFDMSTRQCGRKNEACHLLIRRDQCLHMTVMSS